MSKLKRLGDQINLIEMESKINEPPKLPRCPSCGGSGYINCPQAKAPGGEDFIAIAFEQATACTCAAGQEFARNQMEWLTRTRQRRKMEKEPNIDREN